MVLYLFFCVRREEKGELGVWRLEMGSKEDREMDMQRCSEFLKKQNKIGYLFLKITRIEGWNGVGKDRKGSPFHLEDKLILFVLKFQCDKKHIANSESAVCQSLSLSHHSVL